MKHLTFIITLLLLGCQSNTVETYEKPLEQAVDIETLATKTVNESWIESVNNNDNSLNNFYAIDAVKVNENGEVFSGQSSILNIYQEDNFSIDSIWVNKNVFAGKKENFEYELNEFITDEGQRMKAVVIWDLSQKPKKRTFEFVAEITPNEGDLSSVTERRNEWIYLCNQHKPKALIDDLYTENTIYYNHKPVIIGRNDLVKEYDYMTNKNYNLLLTPIITSMVKPDLVYEIGQCSGTYGGKYILIWQKNNVGKWQVLVDSNI